MSELVLDLIYCFSVESDGLCPTVFIALAWTLTRIWISSVPSFNYSAPNKHKTHGTLRLKHYLVSKKVSGYSIKNSHEQFVVHSPFKSVSIDNPCSVRL